MNLDFIKGADISFVDEIESEGGAFFDQGEQRDVLAILKDSGINAARLRLWNNPTFNYCNPIKTLKMAKRIYEHELYFLLDFHYSDYWADPAKQAIPKQWEQLSFEQLEEAVEQYTASMLKQLKDQGTLPHMVQIGNEITNGMMWPVAKTDEEYNTAEQWEKLGRLVKAGIRGVRQIVADASKLPVMIHIDRGGDAEGSQMFYDRMAEMGIDYEVIGLSYYSWWHGGLEQFKQNIHNLAERYGKLINIVEVAYPWTMIPPDDKGLIFDREEWLHPNYPATVEGQRLWLKQLMKCINDIPNGLGQGMFYWEPCWIPSKQEWSVGHDNNWSNLAMFDYKGNKLASLDVFSE